MKTAICASVVGLMLVGSVTQAGPVPTELAKAVRAYDQAQITGNRAELERLLADDYTLLNSAGTIETKSQLIRDYTAPGNKLEPFVVKEPIEIVWNAGAVMGGIVTLRGIDSGTRFDVTVRFSDIWAMRNGVWQVIYTHVSRSQIK